MGPRQDNGRDLLITFARQAGCTGSDGWSVGIMVKEIVTFVGEINARRGYKFVASPAPEVCTSCKLYQACMSRLKAGRAYEVIDVKDMEHYCPLYEDKVRVVKVVETTVEALVKPQSAVEGAIVTMDAEDCDRKCPLESLCMPEWATKGKKSKIKIEKVMEDVSEMAVCGKKLRKVTARIAESA